MAEALLIPGLALGLGLVLAALRFLRGPHVLDRVVAFDGLTVISISALVLVALATGRGIYLDVALVYALLAVGGGVVAARELAGGE